MDDLTRLAKDMDDAADRLHDRAEDLVRASTLRTEALGKANAPVLTGLLRSSITSQVDSGPTRITGETGPDTTYDVYVHNGTSRQPPNPFMDTAADVVQPHYYAAAERIGGQVLDG